MNFGLLPMMAPLLPTIGVRVLNGGENGRIRFRVRIIVGANRSIGLCPILRTSNFVKRSNPL